MGTGRRRRRHLLSWTYSPVPISRRLEGEVVIPAALTLQYHGRVVPTAPFLKLRRGCIIQHWKMTRKREDVEGSAKSSSET